MKKEYKKEDKVAAVIVWLAFIMMFVGLMIAVWAGIVGLKIIASSLAVLLVTCWVYKVIKDAREKTEQREERED